MINLGVRPVSLLVQRACGIVDRLQRVKLRPKVPVPSAFGPVISSANRGERLSRGRR